jgi:hypothetical protein
MDDLTASEEAEIDAIAFEFVENRVFDGLDCIVILKGRGIRKVAYTVDIADKVPGMLAYAYRDAANYNASKAN